MEIKKEEPDKAERDEDEEEVETIGEEKGVQMVSAVGFGSPVDEKGNPASFGVITFYFTPPEPKKHVHAILGRYAMEWDEILDLAKGLEEFVEKSKVKKK